MPEWCRFLNSDQPEIAQQSKDEINGQNLFAYCCNNPVNYVDYDGYSYSSSTRGSITSLLGKYYSSNFWTRRNSSGYIGEVKIYLEYKNFYKVVYEAMRISEDITFDVMAIYAENSFYKLFKRTIIFDRYCLKNEIKQHVYGYLYSQGYNVKCPTTFWFYATASQLKNNQKKKSCLRAHCKTIDIAEWDVYDTNQKYVFGYFYHIRYSYTYTKGDPYYYSYGRKRLIYYQNSNWGKYKLI